MALLFDIETNGLLDELTTIHSIVIKDTESGETASCADQPGWLPIAVGLDMLERADMIVGHNIITFDIPAIQKLYPGWQPKGVVRDTLVLSRLIWSDIFPLDMKLRRKNPSFPGNLMGSHSLKAWGYRLGVLKGNFGETTDWSEWTPEMQSYCEQDVEVTDALWKLVLSKDYSEEAIELEHRVREIIWKQEQNGVFFDEKAAEALYAELAPKRAALERQLRTIFEPWWVPASKHQSTGKPKLFIPKRDNRKMGYVQGAAMCKIKLVEFNPGSNEHIADRLIKLRGWNPIEFTKTGLPKIDEDILKSLPYPEAEPIAEYLMLTKRISQIAEGNQAWLRCVKNGKIHGGVVTNGAATGRMTHRYPNLAQVPSLYNKKGPVPYGKECREMFYAPKGYVMLGCDASGLELRMLAHYMGRWDGGAYAQEVLGGDIHTVNQKAAGLPARDPAKTFIYAFLYGAGNPLLGGILRPDASKEIRGKIGARLRAKFLRGLPALKMLQDGVKLAAKKRGWLRGLDGRQLPVRSQHSALNTLLQGAGAIVMKKATVLQWDMLHEAGYIEGKDWFQVLNVHDENQLYVKEGLEDKIGPICVEAIRKAGEHFNLRIPLDGEYKSGRNWAETH
ncbi:MAG: DNA polymerase [Proteobacteria bacterium]|nr:DNA polymerase [Pseudomonadota bacterium]MBV1715980.1 hypothetical protein [Desulfarculus sp.]